ncbi:epiplakin [Athene cunicularia]|uniref:epiplakin n=1 Tax=Athene cunicularia TaxID=194338 RepID=UPI000EF6AAC2|nr:epiplakin [Athene cunicularia]
MESRPAVNGHAAPISHQEDLAGANHLCQDVSPRKQKKAADGDVTVTGASSPSSEAAGSIAGVYVEASRKIMSFYDATREHLLSLDSALCLLEAQAATGFITDPVKNRQVSVAEAVQLGLVGLELKERLLAAEKAATGFVDPYTEEKIPLYQAIQKDLIGREQGTRLLEAQMATGGIIDPGTGCRIPADVACERGYLDEEMSQLLSDPSKGDSKGFLNPSTMERVTYRELIKGCVVDPASCLLLLPLQTMFRGLGGRVSSRDLLDSGIISPDTFRGLEEGRVSAQEVAENDSVQQFLHGTRSVAGVVLPSGERKSLYQALREHLLVPGAALMLLQVQASTGSLTDPVKNKSYLVDEAVRIGLVGPELHEKLSSAERTITGYRDPATGEMLSLFQAVRKGFIPQDHGVCLLEAQMATGGIIAPGRHLRVPTEMACRWGYLDEATRQLLSSPTDAVKGFFDPSSKEKVTYADLLKLCVTDPNTGLLLLPLDGDSMGGPEGTHLFFDRSTQTALENTEVPIALGKFKGKSVSLWKLLFSDYIESERRAALAQQYLAGTLSTQELGKAASATAEETASTANVTFEGLRDRVTADQLLSSEIINKDLFKKLKEGETSAKEVVSMDTVKKYLQGTGSIGGLLLPDSQEKISIYQAKRKGLLRPGTSLILLEAQAATGFIIDPAANKRYSVDEALRANIIGPDVYDKLLAAEKSVTGYRDPYSGNKISLFQAMNKEFIVREHAIRLLEAQIATGGIIDPVNSHRIPVEVAYKRGYFDKKMNLILSDPSDDTKGFFDPNTHENLTYLQLKEKCITEPSTGLCLLPLNSRKRQFIDEATRRVFRSSWLPVRFGRLRGEKVSVWDLLNSEYFSEGRRREIFNHYQLRKLTLEQIRIMLVGEMELKARTQITLEGLRGSVPAVWLLDAGILTEQTFEELAQGRRAPKDVAAMESVKRYLQGTGSIAGVFIEASQKKMSFYDAMKNNLLLPGAALRLLEAQAATGYLTDPATGQRLSVRDAVKAAVVGEELTEKLLLAERAVTGYTDPYTGSSISLCQALRKELIPLEDAVPLLEAQLATGGVIDPIHHHHLPLQAARRYGFYDEGLNQTLSQLNDSTKVFFDPNTKENMTYQQLKDRCIHEAESGLWLLPLSENAMFCVDDQTMEVLKSVTVCVNIGRFKGQTVSVWDLLNSEYLSDRKRRELVQKYKDENTEVLQEIITIVTTIIKETETQGKKFAFKGLRKRVSASDLFQSQLIDKKTLDELNQGKKTVQEVTEMESVRRYLEGSNFIAGVLIQPSNKKMSIYQAMRKGILRPGTALVLLEAQAATGYIIDPEKNKKFSVEEALTAGLIGGEIFEKLLCAERAVTGYTDPYTKAPMSLFEAMNQGLIVKSHGIRLLEAQIATGGIIDPVHSHRLPVEVAYQRGYFDQEMNQILSDPSDDTKGFFDPNTHENLTYMQLLERCVQDSETGLYMLQVVQEGGKYFYIDEFTKQVLRSKPLKVEIGKFKDQTVSIWEILCSHYVSEQKRKELVMQYKCRTLTLEDLIALIFKIIEDTEQRAEALKVKGFREDVSVSELFDSEIIDKKTLDQLQDGSLTLTSLTKRDTVRRYLEGTGCIAGVLLPSRKEKMSIYQALRKGLLTEQCALGLLEAQAATGFLIDPLKNKQLSVDEAVSSGLVGSNLHKKLLLAEKAVTGYTDPHTGNKISLFQAIRQKITAKEHGTRLLEAQLATGGVIDPVHSHRLPVEVAYRRGCLDDDMFLLLSDPDHGSKGFIDPNTHEKISYSQLLQRCSKDRDTGLYLLQDRSDVWFQGIRQQITASELLSAQIITEETMEKLHEGKEKAEEIAQMDTVRRYLEGTGCIAGVLVPSKADPATMEKMSIYQAMWKGILRQGTALVLLEAQAATGFIIDPLANKKLSVDEAVSSGLVGSELQKKLACAEKAVTGYTHPYTGQKMSLFQAMKKELIVKEHGIRLLEAQIATGGIIDPVHSHRLPVDVAYQRGYFDQEMNQVLCDPSDDTKGFFDPNTHENLTYMQLLRRCVPDPDTGLLMLQLMDKGSVLHQLTEDARKALQAARTTLSVGLFQGQSVTVWELLFSRYVPDHQREELLRKYKTGTVTISEMITLLTAIVTGAEGQGHGGSQTCKPRQLEAPPRAENGETVGSQKSREQELEQALKTHTIEVSAGSFHGRKVSLWELLFSTYVSEAKRQELLGRVRAGSLALDALAGLLTALVGEAVERSSKVKFTGFRRQVTASDLLDSGIIDKDTLADLVQGSKTVEQVTEMASVKRYLDGTGCIAGVLVPSKADPATMEKMSIYQAMWKGILRQGTALVLLEAQAATGFVVDPLANKKLSVDEAVSSGLVGSELHEKLLSAERAVTGYTDPYTGQQISLFQAMKKGLIVKEHGIRLLEAQIATGGIIDPVHSHRLPVEVAYQRGYFDQEMNQVLCDPSDDTKGFFDPNTHENLTYMQLLHRCMPDPETGLYFLNIFANSPALHGASRSTQEPSAPRAELGLVKVRATCGPAKIRDHSGRPCGPRSCAGAGHSADRPSLLPRSAAGGGGGGPEPAREPGALDTCPADKDGAPQYQDCSPETMRKMSAAPQNNPSDTGSNQIADGHKERGGGGSNFIAGVFIQTMNKKVSIYDAMMRGLLTPGTALVLLEAQAASGFLTDPVRNEKLSVKEALTAGVIGRDFYEKLLSAEGAVTGYTEPYTGQQISLFQAMKKEFIVREHAIRLLEAQIATGGIIDPVHSHRLPVEVAYQRGYFDQEMCQFLSNPKNQTRSCFDPNTHENLTYTQLLRRCVPDPDSGLLLLHVMDKGSVLHQLTEDARKALQAARTTLSVGLFQGQSVTVWELLFSRYVPDHQREELLRKYKTGKVTISEMITLLTAIVTRAEMENSAAQNAQSQEQQLRKSLKSATIYVTAGELQGQNISLLDLLFSKYIPQGKRQELLELYRAGILTTEQVAAVVTTIINRTEPANTRSSHKAAARAEENGDDFSKQDAQLDNILKATTIDVPAGKHQGRQVSVWDLLFSNYIPEEKRQELLGLYRERVLTLEQMITVVIAVIKKKESTSRKLLIAVKTSDKDTMSAAAEKDDASTKEEPWQTALKTTVVDMEVGELRGHKVSVWDLLHSKYIPEENRKELLELYQAGELTLEQVKTVVSTIVTKAEAARAEELANVSSPGAEPRVTEAEHSHLQGDRAWEETLKSTSIEMAVDGFQGRQVSVWDLLFSDYIPEEKRQELLGLYHAGTLTIQELAATGSTIVTNSRERPLAMLPQQTVDLLQSEGSYITFGQFQEKRVSVWELLSTKQVSEYKREAHLDTYGTGGLTVNKITITTTVITGPQRKKRHHQDH